MVLMFWTWFRLLWPAETSENGQAVMQTLRVQQCERNLLPDKSFWPDHRRKDWGRRKNTFNQSGDSILSYRRHSSPVDNGNQRERLSNGLETHVRCLHCSKTPWLPLFDFKQAVPRAIHSLFYSET